MDRGGVGGGSGGGRCGGSRPERRGGTDDPRETTTSPARQGDIITLGGYPLSQDPQAAIDFQGNSDIFEARVIGPPGQARKVEANLETGAPPHVYLPVRAKVTAVYKGVLQPGDHVTLRDLGGTASDGTTLEYENSFPDSTWKMGANVFVFSNQAVTLSDGLKAMTPNMLYVEENGSARSARGQDVPMMPLAEMRSKTQQKWKPEKQR